MDEEITRRKAKGVIAQMCPGCHRPFKFGGKFLHQEVVFRTLTEGEEWIATECWHPRCFDARPIRGGNDEVR